MSANVCLLSSKKKHNIIDNFVFKQRFNLKYFQLFKLKRGGRIVGRIVKHALPIAVLLREINTGKNLI